MIVAIVARCVWITCCRLLDRLLRVFETLEVREILNLLGLGGLSTGVNGDVVGLKLHEGRRVAYLERSRLLVQLRVCR